MSTRYEWFDTAHPFFGVRYLPAHHSVSDGEYVEPVEGFAPPEDVTEADTLLISADEVAVVTGDLEKFLHLVRIATPRPTWPQTPEENNAFADWQYEVANGDTAIGFRDWLYDKKMESI